MPSGPPVLVSCNRDDPQVRGGCLRRGPSCRGLPTLPDGRSPGHTARPSRLPPGPKPLSHQPPLPLLEPLQLLLQPIQLLLHPNQPLLQLPLSSRIALPETNCHVLGSPESAHWFMIYILYNKFIFISDKLSLFRALNN